MQFCQQHWDRLKELIKEAGLYKYVSDGGAALKERAVKELKGEFTIPDPLFACHNNLVGLALQQGGLYLMGQDPDGKPYCPICECKKHGAHLQPDMDEQWLTSEVNSARKWYEAQGLLNEN